MSTGIFKEEIQKALDNRNLANALGNFADAYSLTRAKAFENINFEALREEIASAKAGAAKRMEELAQEFAREAGKRGAIVQIAKSGEEVKKYIAGLALARGVKLIVKSKSMASEEIHLNSYLAAQGFRVRETDLGEWIIQLAGQRPSHMVLPAIHLTKEEVADIFSKEVNKRLQSDIPRLVKLARQELRPSFLAADMGITGANIAVAETGTLVMLTNEGNECLVTTMPPIHVALVGMEKLVAKLADVTPIIKALPKSATAQPITSYVSMITGAVPAITAQGVRPKELHIILMDNNRTKMRDDPMFKQALQCIRCASCLNVCPVYRIVGGHVFGHVYAGGIGTILTAFFNEMKHSEDIQGLCVQCCRCKEICPGKIDIPGLILELRTRLTKEKGLPFTQRIIFESVLADRRRFHGLLRAAAKAQRPFSKGGSMIRHLPLFFSGLAGFRSLPAIADLPLRDRLAGVQKIASNRVTAVLFGGCLIDFAYPEIGEAVAKVLHARGVDVVFPPGQTCCGAPARYSGVTGVAARLARENIKALLDSQAEVVISACPTCTVALKEHFLQVLAGDTFWLAKAKEVAAKVKDFSQYVYELGLGIEEKKPGLKTPLKVAYHDSCHLKRSLGIFREPRELLVSTGMELVEMANADHCCGMGGSYAFKFPDLSLRILQRKLKSIAESGAEVIATDCPGCLMQIRGGLDQRQSLIRSKHTAELLADHQK
ncbi:MAG: LUD domain-containing protein [Syntrophomonadaceae bacterium]|nr:LUD domain-containing protein [Syntrophomonadaceae bacterium]